MANMSFPSAVIGNPFFTFNPLWIPAPDQVEGRLYAGMTFVEFNSLFCKRLNEQLEIWGWSSW
jgi:hypothetical protein